MSCKSGPRRWKLKIGRWLSQLALVSAGMVGNSLSLTRNSGRKRQMMLGHFFGNPRIFNNIPWQGEERWLLESIYTHMILALTKLARSNQYNAIRVTWSPCCGSVPTRAIYTSQLRRCLHNFTNATPSIPDCRCSNIDGEQTLPRRKGGELRSAISAMDLRCVRPEACSNPNSW